MALQMTDFNGMKEVWQLADFKHWRNRKLFKSYLNCFIIKCDTMIDFFIF